LKYFVNDVFRVFSEFDKLLMNYQNRNPPNRAYPVNPAVEGVIMDALRYAHQSLIGTLTFIGFKLISLNEIGQGKNTT
jgi:hypothetical protein